MPVRLTHLFARVMCGLGGQAHREKRRSCRRPVRLFSFSDGDRSFTGFPSDDPPDLSTGDTGAAYVFGSMPVAVEGAPASQRFRLDNPFPNPARRQVTVRYKLGEAVEVRLGIYDVLGREVDVLAAGPQAAGSHEAQLSSGHLPAGLYVLRLMAGQEQMTQRVLIVK